MIRVFDYSQTWDLLIEWLAMNTATLELGNCKIHKRYSWQQQDAQEQQSTAASHSKWIEHPTMKKQHAHVQPSQWFSSYSFCKHTKSKARNLKM
jgi:hypothetical protein